MKEAATYSSLPGAMADGLDGFYSTGLGNIA